MPDYGLKLQIEGMHCGACVRRVTQALQNVEGIDVEEVNVGSARVKGLRGTPDSEAILSALAKIGFQGHVEE